MNLNEKPKNTLIWIIRWVIYIPTIVIVLSLLKMLVLGVFGNLPWWVAIPVWSFLGIGPFLVTLSIYGSGLICPNRKFGNFMFLGLFSIIEIPSFYMEFGISTALENILRFISIFYIFGGFLAAASTPLITPQTATEATVTVDPEI